MLTPKETRIKSQTEISDYVNGQFRKLNNGKAFASEQQTISLNRRGGLPMQYVIQAPNFEKLNEYLPKFLEKVA
ncbi:MAG TPA: hypothetical protein PLL01_17730, partial [Rhodoferax sp.]|nr:hypothetical protein [Rhodoferax sp.]